CFARGPLTGICSRAAITCLPDDLGVVGHKFTDASVVRLDGIFEFAAEGLVCCLLLAKRRLHLTDSLLKAGYAGRLGTLGCRQSAFPLGLANTSAVDCRVGNCIVGVSLYAGNLFSEFPGSGLDVDGLVVITLVALVAALVALVASLALLAGIAFMTAVLLGFGLCLGLRCNLLVVGSQLCFPVRH